MGRGIAMVAAMKAVACRVFVVIGWLAMAGAAPAGRVVTNLDAGRRFSPGDRASAREAGFDDSGWRLLDVPHDWAFEAKFDPGGAQTDKGGCKPGGIGWYRKSFDLQRRPLRVAEESRFRLAFRYAMEDPDGGRPMKLLVNGKLVEQIEFKNTGSWDGDWKVVAVVARLGSGANRIRLETAGESGPNLDEVKVE